ncbi:putative ribonuclease H-like domain-containing protein [Tanacetum coccineum]
MFDGKADEGFLVRYSINSKAFRVFNSRTRKVEENLHVDFLENKPNITGSGPEWLFDIDSLTNSMNYQPVSAGNRTNGNAGLETNSNAGQAGKENVLDQEYILLPLIYTSGNVLSHYEDTESSPKDNTVKKNEVKDPAKEGDMNGQGETTHTNSTNILNTVTLSFATENLGQASSQRNEFKSLFRQDKDDNNAFRIFTPVNAATPSNTDYPIGPFMPDLEDTTNLQNTGIFENAYDDEDVGAEADINNLETTMSVTHIPTTRIHKDHLKNQIIGEMHSAVQTRKMANQNEASLITYINKQRRTNHKDFQNCLFACFLSQMEPKKTTQALDDESWVEAMQEELLQFKLLNVWTLVDLLLGKKAIGTKWVFKNKKDQRGIVVMNKARLLQFKLLNVWTLVDLLLGKKAIGTKWVFKNKKDQRGIVVMNKARLVAQGYRQEEGVDYDDVFAPVARIEAIRLFLAYASYMDFTVVYKVEKALYGLHQAPRAWYETLSTYLLENGFRRGTIDKTLFIKKIKNDILLVQVYVDDIIFRSTQKSLSTEFEQLMHKRFQMSSMGELTFFLAKTPMETYKPLSKDENETDVDVHLYRSIIGSLMYLTSSRPDIMFAVCACSRFQVQPKASHMHAVKRIFRYLKGQPTLGLWYLIRQ